MSYARVLFVSQMAAFAAPVASYISAVLLVRLSAWVPAMARTAGLRFDGGKQASKCQFIVVYCAFQRLQRALQSLAFK